MIDLTIFRPKLLLIIICISLYFQFLCFKTIIENHYFIMLHMLCITTRDGVNYNGKKLIKLQLLA